MKNREQQIKEMNLLAGKLLDEKEYGELSSEERIERIEQIDEQIELYIELIAELDTLRDQLEEEEQEYQRKKKELKRTVDSVRNLISSRRREKNEEQYDESGKELLDLSYAISDKMNALRSKTRRTEVEERELQELAKKLKEVNDLLDKK